MSLKGLFNARWPGVALFDLDGTLVDSAPDLAEAVDLTLQELGRSPAGLEKVRPWVGNGAKVLIRRALADKRDWEPARPEDDLLIESALEIFFKHYRQTNGKHARVYPGVKECLEHLSACGCRMGVVTNKPQQFIAPLLEQTGLAQWFQLTLGGDALPEKKPEPAPVLHAMHQLHGTIGTTVMIGDSVNDVQAALAAGVPCVAVRYGYNFGPSIDSLGADAVVDSLSELL
jgi:phosphoglycolate phosphatase